MGGCGINKKISGFLDVSNKSYNGFCSEREKSIFASLLSKILSLSEYYKQN